MSIKNLNGRVFNPEVIRGYSAYEIAVMHGFEGTEEEWLESLTKDATKQAEVSATAAAESEENAAKSEQNAKQYAIIAATNQAVATKAAAAAEKASANAGKVYDKILTAFGQVGKETDKSEEYAAIAFESSKNANSAATAAKSSSEKAYSSEMNARQAAIDAQNSAKEAKLTALNMFVENKVLYVSNNIEAYVKDGTLYL